MAESHLTPTDRHREYRKAPRGAAVAAWSRLISRAGNRAGYFPTYAWVEVRMTRDEFLAWAIPRYARWFRNHPGVTPFLDRVDTAGHYELANLRLATAKRNANNKMPAQDRPQAPTVPRKPRVERRLTSAERVARTRERRKGDPYQEALRAWKAIPFRLKHSPRYVGIELRMTQEEFMRWAVRAYRRWFKKHPNERPCLDRIDNYGHYELSNLRLVNVTFSVTHTRHSKNMYAPKGTLWCGKCKQYLPSEHFYKRYTGRCKLCDQTYRRERKALRQKKYRPDTVWLTFRGETKSLPEWARQFGLTHGALYHRLRIYGWGIERALTTPLKIRNR